MIYIYDILINLNEEFYEFYEWNENDNIQHVRKIPLFKVSTTVINKIIDKRIIINKKFLESILNKTEIFNTANIEKLKYVSVFSDGKRSVVALFNENGEIKSLSSNVISEELEILEIIETIIHSNIKYTEVKKDKIKSLLSRNERIIIKNIIIELEKIKYDKDKIKYLYYEWFGNTNNVSYDKLKESIIKKFDNKHSEFNEILKLLV